METEKKIWTDYHIDRNTMKRSIQIAIDNTKVRGNVTPINPETMMVKLREPEVYSCEAICQCDINAERICRLGKQIRNFVVRKPYKTLSGQTNVYPLSVAKLLNISNSL